MRTLSTFIALGAVHFASAQIPVMYWGHAFTGPGNTTNYINTCRGVTTDPDGNVYTVGEFANNLDLDPGPATEMVTSAGLMNFDIFLAKYDSLGQFIWAKQIVTGSLCYADWMHRQPGGDLVIGGYLMGTTDFDPGPGVVNVTGDLDLFFARYTPNGDLVWAKTFGSVSAIDELHALAVDATGNIWLAGAFNDTIDLDPGPGVAQFLCTPASQDGFFAKYDPDGNYEWGHTFGNTWGDAAKAISFDAAGNALLAGQFRTSIDVEPGADTTTITQLGTGDDAFVATYSTTGSLIDVFSFGGQASEMMPEAIAVDANGDILVAGELRGNQSSLTPGEITGTINASSNTWGWIAKYTAGGALLWSDVFAGSGSGGPNFHRMAIDSDGDIHIGGSHSDTFDADPGTGTLAMISNGAYLLKLNNADGALAWAVPMGSEVSQRFEGLHIDPADHIYIAGGNKMWSFNGSAIGGGNNAILMKTGECLPPTILTQPGVMSDHCDPTTEVLEVEVVGTGLIYQWYQNGSPIGSNSDTLNVGPLGVGTYWFYCVIDGLCGSDTTDLVVMGVAPTPDPVIIEVLGVLYCTGATGGYQWYLNGTPITGANSANYTPTANGSYTVTLSDTVCVGVSDPFYFGGIGIGEGIEPPISVLHASGSDALFVHHAGPGSPIELFDLTGKRVRLWHASTARDAFGLEDLGEGVYLVKVAERVFRIVR